MPLAALAHPVPDVPVRAWFGSDGSARFEIEIDVRCFSDDPENEAYFVNAVLQGMGDEERSEFGAEAIPFVTRTAKIYFEPQVAEFDPADFVVGFAKVGGGELKAGDDPVAMIARWEGSIPEGATGYRLEALGSGELAVQFINHLDGLEQKRMQVLFPEEISKVLDLSNIAEDAVAGAVAREQPAEKSEPETAPDIQEEVGSEAEADPAEGSASEPISESQEDPATGNRRTLSLVGIVLVGALVVISVLVAKR